jgi:hypothetical protein
MTVAELVERFDDLVAAVQRIADVLEQVTGDGKLVVKLGKVVVTQDRP